MFACDEIQREPSPPDSAGPMAAGVANSGEAEDADIVVAEYCSDEDDSGHHRWVGLECESMHGCSLVN